MSLCGVAYKCAADAARKAIELDPDIADSHSALGLVRLFADWDLPAAEASFVRALSINTDSIDVLHGYSLYLLAADRALEALEVLERAAMIDPLNLPVSNFLGTCYMAARRYADAIEQFERTLALDPRYRSALEGKGWTLFVMGRLDDAIATFERVRDLTPHPKGGISPLAVALAIAGREAEAEELMRILEEREQEEPELSLDLDFAAINAALGRDDPALARLRKAADRRVGALVFLRTSLPWDMVRQIAGFEEFMEEYGL